MTSLLLFEPEFDEMRSTFERENRHLDVPSHPIDADGDIHAHEGQVLCSQMLGEASPSHYHDGPQFACPDCASLAKTNAGLAWLALCFCLGGPWKAMPL
eukprot:157297-Prorocentrum_lima.AAC.1